VRSSLYLRRTVGTPFWQPNHFSFGRMTLVGTLTTPEPPSPPSPPMMILPPLQCFGPGSPTDPSLMSVANCSPTVRSLHRIPLANRGLFHLFTRVVTRRCRARSRREISALLLKGITTHGEWWDGVLCFSLLPFCPPPFRCAPFFHVMGWSTTISVFSSVLRNQTCKSPLIAAPE